MRRSRNYWINHPYTDWLVIAFAFAAYFVLVATGVDSISNLSGGERGILYQTAAGVSGALLGFGIAALAIVAAFSPGRRLGQLLAQHGQNIMRTMMRSVSSIAVSTAVFTIGIATDSGSKASAGRYLAVAAGALVVVRVARLLAVLGALLRIAVNDRVDASAAEEWTPPTVDPADYTMPKRPRSA